MKTLDVALTAMNAALYAAIGYLLYVVFPFLCPTVGVVRFWPVVVIPAVFAVLFGPIVGGVGAAVGIFISDILIHGDPLLSLTAGVTSNFVAFGLIGYMSHKTLDWRKSSLILSIGLTILATVGYLLIKPEIVATYFGISVEQALWNLYLVLAIFVASYIIVIASGIIKPEWRSFGVASIVGAILGSAIIGIGVWGYSQIFALPAVIGGAYGLPYYAALILFAWTFGTEIPFIVILVPPIAEACYRAFPSLKNR